MLLKQLSFQYRWCVSSFQLPDVARRSRNSSSTNCIGKSHAVARCIQGSTTSIVGPKQQQLHSKSRSANRTQSAWNCWYQQRRGLKVSALSLTSKRRQGHKITMITAYDFPSAVHVARANMDIVLVGDSLAMVELGHATTQPITMQDMIHHCAAVQRGVAFANVSNPPLLVGDMPFGSYEYDNTDVALQNAYRFVKEAGMDAVKLEVRRE
jgi:Ketopantoate hydroxymethyltransferase